MLVGGDFPPPENSLGNEHCGSANAGKPEGLLLWLSWHLSQQTALSVSQPSTLDLLQAWWAEAEEGEVHEEQRVSGCCLAMREEVCIPPTATEGDGQCLCSHPLSAF